MANRVEEMIKSMQVQLKILENKIKASKTKISDFQENNLDKEINEVQNNAALSEEQKNSSLDLLVS